MAKITVHAGDFPAGQASLNFGVLLMPSEKLWHQWGEKIQCEQLEAVEMASEESVKRLGGTIGWGAVGGALLGPAGLLAGLLLGGKSTEVTFVVRFKDGRKMLATSDTKTYGALLKFAF